MMKKGDFGATPKGKKHSNVSKQGYGLYQLLPRWSFVKCDMQNEKWGISQMVHGWYSTGEDGVVWTRYIMNWAL